jgi:hypothetical protein
MAGERKVRARGHLVGQLRVCVRELGGQVMAGPEHIHPGANFFFGEF